MRASLAPSAKQFFNPLIYVDKSQITLFLISSSIQRN
jgi:hypothetical protein